MRPIRWTTLQAIALLSAFASAAQAQEPAPGTATPAAPGTQAGTDVQARPPIRIGGQIAPPRKIKDVRPEYPVSAQSKRIQGIVILEATIDESGKVSRTQVVRSVPGLDEAAADAVRQWEFTPTLIDGMPRPVIMSVTVTFTLDGGGAPLPSSRREPPGPMEIRATRTFQLRQQSPTRIAGDLPSYPQKARDGETGTVTIRVTVDDKGRVREARSLSDVREATGAGRGSAPAPLGKAFVDATIKAVKTWHFPPPAQSPFVYELRFRFVPGQPAQLI